jgi:hypothetical protein
MKKKLFTMVMLVFLAGTTAFGQELTSLSVSKGTLSPALTPGTYAYTVNLYTLNASEELTISAAAGEGYTVDGDTDAKTVEPGQTYNYSIQVNETEEESPANTYTITVNVYERKLVIKPVGTVDMNISNNSTNPDAPDDYWDAQFATTDIKYEMTYTGEASDGTKLYKCTMNLRKYSKGPKWESKFGYTPAANGGWSDIHQYLIVYKDEFASNGGAISTSARTFILDKDLEEVTFYARVNADGKIRIVCDAQELRFSYQTNSALIALFNPAIGKSGTSTIGEISDSKDNQQIKVCSNSNDAGDFGLFRTNVFNIYNYGAVIVDFESVSFTVKKVLDGLNNSMIKIGDEGFESLDSEESFVSGVFTDTEPLVIGGSVDGFIKAYQWEKGVRTVTITDLNDFSIKLNYEIIPDGQEEGEVFSIALTTSTQSLTCSDVNNPTSATWSNTVGADISSGLVNGTYTLKVWYSAEAYGTTLFEDYIITAGKGSGAKYYTTTFTIDNPPVWTGGTDGDWNNPANWSTGEAPSLDDPETEIEITIADSDNAPTFPAAATLKSITFEPGAGADIADGGTLSVSEAIKVNMVVSSGRWYSIGFPFDIAKVAGKWDAELKAYEENEGGNFWLKKYTENENTEGEFEYVQEIKAGKGYIIQFPSGFANETITFISEPISGLSAGTITPEATYQLVANPTLNRMELSAEDGNNHYYLYDPVENKYNLLEGTDTGILAPFEAPITIMTPPSGTQSLVRSIGGDGYGGSVTGIDRGFTIESADPVIATRYYTLQGVEIQQPVEKTIYIIKKTYASQKVETGKVVYIQK